MPETNEAFSRVKIDAQLKDRGWDVPNPNAVGFEYVLPDKTKADYVLCDRHGRALAVIEAKKAAINPAEAKAAGGRAWGSALVRGRRSSSRRARHVAPQTSCRVSEAVRPRRLLHPLGELRVGKLLRDMQGLGDAARAKLLAGNARRFLGLP
jgi:hypothetical protein